jgi:TRAP-type C4-dicarboxylate transport system substrate-binding protein
LKEILEQISKIDAIAYENEQKIKSILARERKRLEDEMKEYRDRTLSDAEEKARALYDQIKSKTNDECLKNEDMIRKYADKLKTNYQASEEKIVRDIIDRLIEREQ